MRNSGAFVGNIRHDIGDVTIQYAAEHINCVRADALPTLQPCDLSGTDTVLFDECVLRDAFSCHGEPQIFIGDHNIPAPLST